MGFWEFFGVIGLAATAVLLGLSVSLGRAIYRDVTRIRREGRKLVRETERALSDVRRGRAPGR